MEHEEHLSLSARIVGSILFSSLTIISLVWFFSSISTLISDLSELPEIITFNKGAIYMLGVAIGCGCFSTGILYYSINLKKTSKNIESILLKGILIGIIVMFSLPSIIHFSVDSIIEKNQYKNCENLTYSWLMYKKFIYTRNPENCDQLAIEKIETH